MTLYVTNISTVDFSAYRLNVPVSLPQYHCTEATSISGLKSPNPFHQWRKIKACLPDTPKEYNFLQWVLFCFCQHSKEQHNFIHLLHAKLFSLRMIGGVFLIHSWWLFLAWVFSLSSHTGWFKTRPEQFLNTEFISGRLALQSVQFHHLSLLQIAACMYVRVKACHCQRSPMDSYSFFDLSCIGIPDWFHFSSWLGLPSHLKATCVEFFGLNYFCCRSHS
jgi:hypothetical protein